MPSPLGRKGFAISTPLLGAVLFLTAALLAATIQVENDARINVARSSQTNDKLEFISQAIQADSYDVLLQQTLEGMTTDFAKEYYDINTDETWRQGLRSNLVNYFTSKIGINLGLNMDTYAKAYSDIPGIDRCWVDSAAGQMSKAEVYDSVAEKGINDGTILARAYSYGQSISCRSTDPESQVKIDIGGRYYRINVRIPGLYDLAIWVINTATTAMNGNIEGIDEPIATLTVDKWARVNKLDNKLTDADSVKLGDIIGEWEKLMERWFSNSVISIANDYIKTKYNGVTLNEFIVNQEGESAYSLAEDFEVSCDAENQAGVYRNCMPFRVSVVLGQSECGGMEPPEGGSGSGSTGSGSGSETGSGSGSTGSGSGSESEGTGSGSSVIPSVPSEQNPEITDGCSGMDILIVIDHSPSIDETELAKVKNAVNSFVDTILSKTPSMVGAIEFDEDAEFLLPEIFSSNAEKIKSSVNSISIWSGTNWESALRMAYSGVTEHDPRPDKPNLIIFMSDGNPVQPYGNAYDLDQQDIDSAVTEANRIKQGGTRIISIGIGNTLTRENMIALSGAGAYYDGNFNQLAGILEGISSTLCSSAVATPHLAEDESLSINYFDPATDLAAMPTAGTAGTPSSQFYNLKGLIMTCGAGTCNNDMRDVMGSIIEPFGSVCLSYYEYEDSVYPVCKKWNGKAKSVLFKGTLSDEDKNFVISGSNESIFRFKDQQPNVDTHSIEEDRLTCEYNAEDPNGDYKRYRDNVVMLLENMEIKMGFIEGELGSVRRWADSGSSLAKPLDENLNGMYTDIYGHSTLPIPCFKESDLGAYTSAKPSAKCSDYDKPRVEIKINWDDVRARCESSVNNLCTAFCGGAALEGNAGYFCESMFPPGGVVGGGIGTLRCKGSASCGDTIIRITDLQFSRPATGSSY